MPVVWRLAPPAFARALDGEGSRLVGGRWNSPGRHLVYTSSHLSLAVLEAYVNIAPALRDELPEFEAVRISVPDGAGGMDVSIALIERLMAGPTRRQPADPSVMIGFLLAPTSPASALRPGTRGAQHHAEPHTSAHAGVAILSMRRFRFDPRLVDPRLAAARP